MCQILDFSFLRTFFLSFLHYLCLQILYPTNFLIRECFSLLVSSIFNFIVDDICQYWQVLTSYSYSYEVAFLIEDRALMQFPAPHPPLQLSSRADARFCSGSALYRTREDSTLSTVSILEVFLSSFADVMAF